jgi:hypothetical protein
VDRFSFVGVNPFGHVQEDRSPLGELTLGGLDNSDTGAGVMGRRLDLESRDARFEPPSKNGRLCEGPKVYGIVTIGQHLHEPHIILRPRQVVELA